MTYKYTDKCIEGGAELDQEWVAFKQTHNKEYEGEEEAKRYVPLL
jgi:hypothetical protein